MILTHAQLDAVLDASAPKIPSLVIESPLFFRKLLTDLYSQKQGVSGDFVLSHNGSPLEFGTWTEIIDRPLTPDFSNKALMGKVLSALEKHAVSEGFFLKTAELLQQTEQYLEELLFDFRSDLVCTGCTVSTFLKGAGISLRDTYDDPLEKLIDYMDFAREFDRDKLFIFIHLRSLFSAEELSSFLQSLSLHNFHVLLLDSFGGPISPYEYRITVDNDLCEF